MTTYYSDRQEEGPDTGLNRCGETPPKRKRMWARIETNYWNYWTDLTCASLKVAQSEITT